MSFIRWAIGCPESTVMVGAITASAFFSSDMKCVVEARVMRWVLATPGIAHSRLVSRAPRWGDYSIKDIKRNPLTTFLCCQGALSHKSWFFQKKKLVRAPKMRVFRFRSSRFERCSRQVIPTGRLAASRSQVLETCAVRGRSLELGKGSRRPGVRRRRWRRRGRAGPGSRR